MLKINTANLKEGEQDFEFDVLADELELESDEKVTDLRIKAIVYKSGNQLSITLKVAGKFELQCDRCLEDFDYLFENSHKVIYKMTAGEFEKNSEDDEIKFISGDTHFIDLKNDVRDFLLLSIPMRKVPKDKNGICSYCGKDTEQMLKTETEEEVNPVWEKLIKAKTK